MVGIARRGAARVVDRRIAGGASAEACPHLGLYLIITSQYSSTTLYQISYHNYSVAVFFYSGDRICPSQYLVQNKESRRAAPYSREACLTGAAGKVAHSTREGRFKSPPAVPIWYRPIRSGSAASAAATASSTRVAPSSGRQCHSTLSLAVIDWHCLGIYTVILLSFFCQNDRVALG